MGAGRGCAPGWGWPRARWSGPRPRCWGAEALLRAFPDFALGLRLAGACWLAWIGFRMLRGALRGGADDVQAAPPSRHFRAGFAVQMTNPKAALFFGSVLTAFVPPEAGAAMRVEVVLFCVAFAVAGHSITATLFSTPPARAVFASARRRISGLFGAGFIGLGALAAADALRGR